MYAYSNNGLTLRGCDRPEDLVEGEIFFDHEATEEELASAFAGYTVAKAALDTRGYRDARAVAYRDRLGSDVGDYVRTLGDVVDTLIAQAEATRVTAGAARTADFDAMLKKILAIKAEFPKP